MTSRFPTLSLSHSQSGNPLIFLGSPASLVSLSDLAREIEQQRKREGYAESKEGTDGKQEIGGRDASSATQNEGGVQRMKTETQTETETEREAEGKDERQRKRDPSSQAQKRQSEVKSQEQAQAVSQAQLAVIWD